VTRILRRFRRSVRRRFEPETAVAIAYAFAR
jgi:hypothetical protein